MLKTDVLGGLAYFFFFFFLQGVGLKVEVYFRGQTTVIYIRFGTKPRGDGRQLVSTKIGET